VLVVSKRVSTRMLRKASVSSSLNMASAEFISTTPAYVVGLQSMFSIQACISI
jgi:hypothetical protein